MSLQRPGTDHQPLRAFSRKHRLLTSAEFAHVFSEATRSSDRFFTVLGRRADHASDVSRLGLAIAKKQLRRAVDRNRVKRIVRESFRTVVIPDSRIPLDYVVMARSTILQADNARLRDSLLGHFGRIQKQALERE